MLPNKWFLEFLLNQFCPVTTLLRLKDNYYFSIVKYISNLTTESTKKFISALEGYLFMRFYRLLIAILRGQTIIFSGKSNNPGHQ
jgi:hypothetical protein